MAARSASLQDQFLNALRRSHQSVSLFVLKGVRLQGLIAGFDPYAIELRRNASSQLVYKHSIASIVPSGPMEALAIDPPRDDPGASLQDRFLAKAAANHDPLTLFLVNGVMLEGEVAGFDQFSLLLGRGRLVQLVYKHAISTIQPDGQSAGAAASNALAESVE